MDHLKEKRASCLVPGRLSDFFVCFVFDFGIVQCNSFYQK